MFPECLLRLAPGDDFACRAPVRQFGPDAVLTAKVGRREMTTETKASCPQPPSSKDFADAFTVRVEDEVCGGDDPTFRFELRNPTAARLTDVFIQFPGTDTASQTLICGASNGTCDLRTVPAGTPADSFEECALRLAPGDDFACRASLLQARVDAVVSANADGAAVGAKANASCAATPPPADECAGMVPESVGDSIEVALPLDPLFHQRTCGGTGTSDGEGNFALVPVHAGDADGDESRFGTAFFVTVQDGKAKQIGTMLTGGEEGFFTMFPQPSGFILFATHEPFQDRTLRVFSHEGVQQGMIQLTTNPPSGASTAVQVGNDPAGGMVAVRWLADTSDTHVTTYQRFDSQGHALTDEIDIQSSFFPLAVGVDVAGNALVITGTGTVATFQGRWFSRRGKPLTAWFTFTAGPVHAGANFPEMQIVQIAGGNLALRQDRKFVLMFRDAHGPEPLPAWLADRSDSVLSVVRGGRANASFARAGSCGASGMEILTTSGRSCGCVAVVGAVGRDGSVIAAQPRDPIQCTQRLFPQLLK
jgi:hypothetical protein